MPQKDLTVVTFAAYARNEETFLDVIRMHGRHAGFRNAQVTVIAPTGIEPDLALVKNKKLVGGGVLQIVNQTVPQALIRLGYSPEQVERIGSHIDSTGAISKTINMPEDSTVEDISNAYLESWRLGLKAVAIYRDNSKRVQPLSTGKSEWAAKAPATVEKIVYRPLRRKLPDERQAVTHKFSISGHEGYITVGLYDDGQPGEVFITMAKAGSTISGLMDGFATAISFTLQYGVPLKFLVDKFSHVRFEPDGWTGNPQVPYAKSILDYIFRWMGAKFLGPEYTQQTEAGESEKLRPTEPEPQQSLPFGPVMGDAPICSECGGLMTRNGSCYKCENCGGTSGCS